MSNVLKMLSRGGAAAAETDPNFKQTVLLLHGDGTNGAQNNTFLDSSTNNVTITRNGNTTQGTFSPFSAEAGKWSNYFDGTGDYINPPSNTALSLGTGDFTLECWVYATSTPSDVGIYEGRTNGNAGTVDGFTLTAFSGSVIRIFSNGILISSSGTNYVNTWCHVAVTRSSGTWNLYINGVSQGTSTTARTLSNNEALIGVGRYGATSTPTAFFPGYISNFRIVKGTAVYTSNFTPPTTPLTAITNTSLLTCQSNRFVDNSTNAFAITRNGDVKVTPFSPFAPSAAYSASTNGGSGYFDGSGDYLNFTGTNFNVGTNAFTLEGWIYQTTNQYSSIISTFNSTNTGVGFFLGVNNVGQPEFQIGNGSVGGQTAIVGTTAIPLNSWVHLAATKAAGSGGTMTLYVNGVSVGTTTTTRSIDRTAAVIGRYYQDLNNYYLTGYIANVRVSDTVRSISVPTSPLVSDGNTLFLCNFTNAGIIDNTGKNVLETVGNAQIDTGTKKYGTGSMEFDGTGDYLVIPNSPEFAFGTGNFTLEFWINFSNISGYQTIYSYGYTTSGDLLLQTGNGNGRLIVYVNGSAAITETGTASTGTWIHYALVRSGTTLTLYRDGTSTGTTTNSTNIVTTEVVGIGANPISYGGEPPGTYPFNGFIDDLRITKGVARYTANFTAPTKEFPDL